MHLKTFTRQVIEPLGSLTLATPAPPPSGDEAVSAATSPAERVSERHVVADEPSPSLYVELPAGVDRAKSTIAEVRAFLVELEILANNITTSVGKMNARLEVSRRVRFGPDDDSAKGTFL